MRFPSTASRVPFGFGLAAGLLVTAALLAVLISIGTVSTDALYVEREGVVRMWDTHGSSDPDRWELVTRATRIADARHIYVETGDTRVVYAGTAAAPATFALVPEAPTRQRLRPSPRGDRTLVTSAVDVEYPNNAEVRASFTVGDTRIELLVRGGDADGFRVGVQGPGEARVNLLRLTGRWAVGDRVRTFATGPRPGRGAYSVRRPAGSLWSVASEAGPTLTVSADRPSQLDLETDPLGLVTMASLAVDATTDPRVFIALTQPGVTPAAIGPGTRSITVHRAGVYLVTPPGRGERDRLVTLSPGRQAAPQPRAQRAGIRGLDSAEGIDGLREEARGALALP